MQVTRVRDEEWAITRGDRTLETGVGGKLELPRTASERGSIRIGEVTYRTFGQPFQISAIVAHLAPHPIGIACREGDV
jgi:hypothetical protein